MDSFFRPTLNASLVMKTRRRCDDDVNDDDDAETEKKTKVKIQSNTRRKDRRSRNSKKSFRSKKKQSRKSVKSVSVLAGKSGSGSAAESGQPVVNDHHLIHEDEADDDEQVAPKCDRWNHSEAVSSTWKSGQRNHLDRKINLYLPEELNKKVFL